MRDLTAGFGPGDVDSWSDVWVILCPALVVALVIYFAVRRMR